MTSRRILVLVLTVVASLIITISGVAWVSVRRELHGLRESHAAREKFCRLYRARVHWAVVELASDQLSTQQFAAQFLGDWSQQAFLDLCEVDPRELQPERGQLQDCDTVFQARPDYSCAARLAAKLEQAIPDHLAP
jgi:hypothetical protein